MTNVEEQQSLALNRIATALERIAIVLEPSDRNDARTLCDRLDQIRDCLGDDGALAGVHNCLGDISDALNGGRSTPETTIVESLEDIAHAVNTQL